MHLQQVVGPLFNVEDYRWLPFSAEENLSSLTSLASLKNLKSPCSFLWLLHSDPDCPLCQQNRETLGHLFLLCSWTQEIQSDSRV